MPDIDSVVSWLVPALVVLGGSALLVVLIVWATKRARRGRRARAKAETAIAETGAALVELDDAVDELELELGLSGALYGGDPPAALRRARMTAQHTRDDAFAEFRAMQESAALPVLRRRTAQALRLRIGRALTAVADGRAEHRAWIDAHTSAPAQVDAAHRRLASLRERIGDPAALVSELEERADPSEWSDAADDGASAASSLDEAERLLGEARRKARDPSASALDDLAAAERALRRAEQRSRALEERHRIVLQAKQAVAGELEAASAAVRSATGIRAALEPDDAERLGREIETAVAEIASLRREADRRPVHANEEIARLRDRLDRALADARTAQQRLLGARSALPGTLAAARSALARADAAIRPGASLDARVRLDAAREELAKARQTADPVEALDDARRAIRHAEDAKALSDHDRLRA
ncbi:hypothetical protein N8K70_00215 [Microbacterium betulae]|uniref:Uncharacterized protein n=1 Tax=Microbacterium betulae TaxID=2981139 RepID=A0AA97FJD5_9MICO|nr:hypothetical protein [Microbacterium sp. AB]WOF23124.1 hypothetical protein N8K70_00215 [Microbacterium sp. AB]